MHLRIDGVHFAGLQTTFGQAQLERHRDQVDLVMFDLIDCAEIFGEDVLILLHRPDMSEGAVPLNRERERSISYC